MADTEGRELQKAFEESGANYRGKNVDLYSIYRDMRKNSPIVAEDFMGKLGVPNIAGHDPDRPTFTIFKYQDVMAVLRDAKKFTSGFIAEGLGSFVDGLILTGMDGDEHRKIRALLKPIFMPQVANTWRETVMDPIIRNDYLLPMLPDKKADLMTFGLHFPIRLIYSLIGFPDDEPEKINQYAAWAMDILQGPQVDPANAKAAREAAMSASKQLYDAVIEHVREVRAAGAEGGDLISRLIAAEYEGGHLDDHEIATFVRSLLPAASETTSRTFGSLMVLLLERPDLLERVRNDRELVMKAIDETNDAITAVIFSEKAIASPLEFVSLSN